MFRNLVQRLFNLTLRLFNLKPSSDLSIPQVLKCHFSPVLSEQGFITVQTQYLILLFSA